MFIYNLHYVVISSNYVKVHLKMKEQWISKGNNTPISDKNKISPYNTN